MRLFPELPELQSIQDTAHGWWEGQASRPVEELPWVVQAWQEWAFDTWRTVCVLGNADLPCYFKLHDAFACVRSEQKRDVKRRQHRAYRLLHRTTDQTILVP